MQNCDPASENSSRSAEKLELPVEKFVSEPPKVDFQTMLARIEQNIAARNARPGETERRLREKIDVEFVLKD